MLILTCTSYLGRSVVKRLIITDEIRPVMARKFYDEWEYKGFCLGKFPFQVYKYLANLFQKLGKVRLLD